MILKKRPLTAAAKRHLEMREELWPAQAPSLWDRNVHKGFTTIPKTMPLVLKIMDEMSKGRPVSSTYMTLWCSTWDNSFAPISKPRHMAVAAGFGGQRGERTWATRMKLLQELEFIDIKPGTAGPISFALIYNPHLVIRRHHQRKTPGLIEASYNALLEWAADIGAKDMFGEETPTGPGLAA